MAKRKRFAKNMAKYLFTNVRKTRAYTLDLMSKEKENLGGWCQEAVEQEIYEHLTRVDKR